MDASFQKFYRGDRAKCLHTNLNSAKILFVQIPNGFAEGQTLRKSAPPMLQKHRRRAFLSLVRCPLFDRQPRFVRAAGVLRAIKIAQHGRFAVSRRNAQHQSSVCPAHRHGGAHRVGGQHRQRGMRFPQADQKVLFDLLRQAAGISALRRAPASCTCSSFSAQSCAFLCLRDTTSAPIRPAVFAR